MPKFRNILPLHTIIVETLSKKGPLTDVALYKAVEKDHGEVSYRELNKTLMGLEVNGIIHVSSLTKNKRRVELREMMTKGP